MENTAHPGAKHHSIPAILLLILAIFAATLVVPSRVDAQVVFEEVDGTLDDGTAFHIRKPENWNGSVITDLDFRPRRNTAFYLELLERGYGLAGTERRSDRTWTVSTRHDARRVQEALEMFKAEFGEPETVISYGASAGGAVALVSSEVYPETTDGAVALCATIPVLTNNQIFDFFFVLKQLLGPDDETLVTHNIPIDNQHIQDRWFEVIEEAGSTPEGRARLAMAFALSQYPAFGGTGGAGVPMPDFNDPDDVADAMIESAIQIADARINIIRVFELEDVPPGIPLELIDSLGSGRTVWNVGADYFEYWALADPVYRDITTDLYRRAGLDLKTDLQQINDGPRVQMDPEVSDRAAEQDSWVRGLPQVPLFRVENLGDQTNPAYPTMQSYTELVERNGLTDLYRTAVTAPGGHCFFSDAERLAAIDVMVERLTTGEWPATDAAAMNARSGSDTFLDYDFSRSTTMWRLREFPAVFNAGPPTAIRKDDCKNGGWRFLGDAKGEEFSNQGQCVGFVASNGLFGAP